MNSKELTVVTVLKTGPTWLPEYAYRVRDAVKEHLNRPHRFVCLSDQQLAVETLPLVLINNPNAWGVWYKVQMFRPELKLNGPTLYIDLDTIIKGPLDPLIDDCWNHDFLMSSDPWKGDISCSALMFWRGDHSNIWKQFQTQPIEHWMQLYQIKGQIEKFGDQGFISDQVKHKLIQHVISSPNLVARISKRPAGDKHSILFCSGSRKPWLSLNHPDVQKYWAKYDY